MTKGRKKSGRPPEYGLTASSTTQRVKAFRAAPDRKRLDVTLSLPAYQALEAWMKKQDLPSLGAATEACVLKVCQLEAQKQPAAGNVADFFARRVAEVAAHSEKHKE